MRNKGTILVVGMMLALALGGTATAAKLITSKDIKNGTIQVADLSASAKSALKGQQGLAGPQGAQGPGGALGQQVVESAPVTVMPGTVGGAQAFCPAGTAPVGTGFNGSIARVGFVNVFGTSVGGGFVNDRVIAVDVTVQAICAGGGVSASSTRERRVAEAAFARSLKKYSEGVSSR